MRKLAKELDRSAEDLLWLLHEKLALPRYGSPDDMLPDEVAEQLRKASRTNTPRALLPQAPARPATVRTLARAEPQPDLMAGLVPGVVPTGRKSAPKAPRAAVRPAGAAAAPASGAARPATLADERQSDARTALAEERRRLEAARAELDAARIALDQQRAALEELRATVTEERARLEQDTAHRAGELAARSLAGLLDERGLKGSDEHGRALAALAAAGHLARLATQLLPIDAPAVRQLLRDRLTLASGPLPESVGPVVWVTTERADLRGGAELDRQLVRLGESWLLEGRRRVVWLGVPPRFHSLLRERIDRRVELTFRPGGERDEARAQDDLTSGDLVIAWNIEATPGARAVWGRSPGKVVEVQGRSLSDVLDRLGRRG